MGRIPGMVGALVAGTVFMVGCASVDVAKTFNDQRLTEQRYTPIAHINGDCWGIYFLSIIPLVTGDTTTEGTQLAFLKDTVNVDAVADMVTRKSKELGATHTLNLTSQRFSSWIAPVLLFWYKDTQVSGNAVN
ncbi:MAG: hypothetical protein ABSA67_04700 [Candidatus Brocadiia bacterium]|jgi:hypothetical protein